MNNTPGNKTENKIREFRRDGLLQLTSLNGKLEPDLNILSKKENIKVVEKKIVNNKPSQFGPILGVNFHMLKK